MLCTVCSSDTLHALRIDDNTPLYYQCLRCEYIAIDSSHILSPEEEKSRYCTHENTSDNEGYVRRFREFIEQCISPYQDGMKTALDFGCGPGPVLADLLKEQGLMVDIYDPYFAPYPIHEQTTYDLITATETLEHIRDPLATLRILKERLTSKGILAIMTLFHPNSEDLFKKWWYWKDPTHISFYTPKTFRILSERIGMSVVMSDDKNLCVLRRE